MKYLLLLFIILFAQSSAEHPIARICGVVYNRLCNGTTFCPNEPIINYDNWSVHLKDFNAVSFANFGAASGDVEGRLAVKSNLNVGAWSVGFEIKSGGTFPKHNTLPFSLIVGNDAVFSSGQVFPDGSTDSPKEDMFIGNNFVGAPYLLNRVKGSCSGNIGCLNSDFENAQAYYGLLSHQLADEQENTNFTVQYGFFNLECDSALESSYYIKLQANEFEKISFYPTPKNCNPSAQFIFNIIGDDKATITIPGANHIQTDKNESWYGFDSTKILFNFPGIGQIIKFQNAVVNGHILAPYSSISTTATIYGIVIAGDLPDVTQVNLVQCPLEVVHSICPTIDQDCKNISLFLTLENDTIDAKFGDFDVISFGNFIAETGDVQGRLAVKGNLDLGLGYSVGDQLQTVNGLDRDISYSLVVGGNANWESGNLFPDGSNVPYPGKEAKMFIGGNFTGATYLASRIGGSCGNESGCLDAYFDQAQNCYRSLSRKLASVSDNVDAKIEFSALLLTCHNSSELEYYVTIDADLLHAKNLFILDNCNSHAAWVINVEGQDNVTFSGDSFPSVSGVVIYNVLGKDRSIIVHDTGLTGHILAPDNILYQLNGKIDGKVVVGSVEFALQMNRYECPNPAVIRVTNVLTKDVFPNNDIVQVAGRGFIVEGDKISFDDGESFIVYKSIEDQLQVNEHIRKFHSAGSVINAEVDPSEHRQQNHAATHYEVSEASNTEITWMAISSLIALLF